MVANNNYKILLGLFLLLSTFQVKAMAGIGFKICLASQMKGTVTFQGSPVSGEKVTRTVLYNNKEWVDETTTDTNGQFSFDSLYERSVWKHSPFEVLISQDIKIDYKGETHEGIRISKRNFADQGELNEEGAIKAEQTLIPFDFTCELTDDVWGRYPQSNESTLLHGRCLFVGETKSEK